MHYIFGFSSQQVQRISTHSLSYFWTQCNFNWLLLKLVSPNGTWIMEHTEKIKTCITDGLLVKF